MRLHLFLLLWGLVIISGRMIAYNWFDCDKQPQSELINFLISCTVDPQFYEYLNESNQLLEQFIF